MSNFAAAIVRGESEKWSAAVVDLSGVADIDDVADRLRDVDQDANVSILFVEADDTYLVVLRLDDGEDLRVFGSDGAYAEESRLGAILLGDVEEPALEIDDVATEVDADEEPADLAEVEEEEEEPTLPAPGDADPVGDADLLADLGVPAQHLIALCQREGMMPADITAEVCELIGCADDVEEIREA